MVEVSLQRRRPRPNDVKPQASTGQPEIDDALSAFPDDVSAIFGGYEQRSGYKCWKVPGKTKNWLQWNDGGTSLPIRFDDSHGVTRTWKLFARFQSAPSDPWLKPSAYGDHKWMPGGPDVWGCPYDALSRYLNRLDVLEGRMKRDLEVSLRYILGQYT